MVCLYISPHHFLLTYTPLHIIHAYFHASGAVKKDRSGMTEHKVVVVGAGAVGKTALILQFVSSHFEEKYDPTIEDFFRKDINVDGSRSVLEIIDTAGTEQFASMRNNYIQHGEGFLLVYSIATRQSFIDVQQLRESIVKVKGEMSSPILMVGNKCDLEEKRSVSKQDGERLALEWGCQFFET